MVTIFSAAFVVMIGAVGAAAEFVDFDAGREYGDFELRFDFKLVSTKADAGVVYRSAGARAPEYQIIDFSHPNATAGRDYSRCVAALYDDVPAHAHARLYRRGEWNTGKIVCRGKTLEHWINGARCVKVERDWLADRGRIMLEDEKGGCLFRNLKIREIRPPAVVYEDTLRDHCWMWGHDTGVYDGTNNLYKIPVSAPISMADACHYMGIPNVCVIRWQLPEPGYMEQFKTMKRFTWVLTGERGAFDRFRDFVFKTADEYPNFVGMELDDFFLRRYATVEGDGELCKLGQLPLRRIDELRHRMADYRRPLDLRMVTYERDFDPATEVSKGNSGCAPALRRVDTAMYWTWNGEALLNLEENFARYRKDAPEKPTLLGIYMWNFGGRRPIPLSLMRKQLDVAFDFYRRGAIDGFVFHCTPLVNKNLEAVEYARKWIAEHGDYRRNDERVELSDGVAGRSPPNR
ncbi:MAG: DUF1080 domain-containing protein [Kiritimatiellae bacterium]|nr:DUF1080 domain-containing protein [Kiritimatiellia bacterium]